jgi:hypothetical protein
MLIARGESRARSVRVLRGALKNIVNAVNAGVCRVQGQVQFATTLF